MGQNGGQTRAYFHIDLASITNSFCFELFSSALLAIPLSNDLNYKAVDDVGMRPNDEAPINSQNYYVGQRKYAAWYMCKLHRKE